MKRLLSFALILCIMTVFLCGCSPLGIGSGELMKPPKTSGDEQQITALIEKNAGTGYTLKYPENGGNRSSIIIRDLDFDGESEAVAFYQVTVNKDATTYMLVMHEGSQGWEIAGSYKTLNTNIDRVEFSDITGNGKLEIICGFKTFNSNVNQLVIFSYEDGNASQMDVSHTYTSFVLNDFNGDQKNDILALSIYADKNSEASLLSYDESRQKMQISSSVKLDQNVTGFENIASGMLNSDTVGAAVDGIVSNDKLCTQIIYFDSRSNSLVNALYSDSGPAPNPTIRDGKTYCMDIDDDNIIEIPVLSKMPYTGGENAEFVVTSAVWNEFDTASATLAENCYMMVLYYFGFYFQLSKEALEKTTARIDAEDSSVTVYEWSDGNIQNPLLTIKIFNTEDLTKTGKPQGYTLIREEGAKSYYYKIHDVQGSFSFSDEDIQQSFRLFSDYYEK